MPFLFGLVFAVPLSIVVLIIGTLGLVVRGIELTVEFVGDIFKSRSK